MAMLLAYLKCSARLSEVFRAEGRGSTSTRSVRKSLLATRRHI
jgi:hypothetical protein